MDHLTPVKNLNQDSKKSRHNDVIKYALVFTVSLAVVLIVLTSYVNIMNLMGRVEYFVFPSKESADYERLTDELITLYGSGKVEYYQPENQIFVSDNLENSNSYIFQDNASPQTTYFPGETSGNYLYIPGISVDAPIILGTSTEDKVVLDQLKRGVLVYPGSSLPASGGSTVIIGHSSSYTPWNRYSYIFSSLPELSEGDMVIINYDDKKYSYVVDGKLIGSVGELAALDIKSDLILGTCWPIGTSEKRILITASLVS